MGLMSHISTRHAKPASPEIPSPPISNSASEKKSATGIFSAAATSTALADPPAVPPAAISAPAQKKTRSDEFPRLPHEEIFLAEKIPCKICGGEWFWESIYFDGVIRCGKCNPFPGWEFVGRKISRTFLENESGERSFFFEQRVTDGKAPGSPTTLADGAGDAAVGGEDAAAASECDIHGLAGSSTGDQDAEELADRFVEYQTADGRTGYALRGFNVLRHRNYDQRVNAYVQIGVNEYDRRLGMLQGVWRREVVKG